MSDEAATDARLARQLAVIDQDLGAGRLERPRLWLPRLAAAEDSVAALLQAALAASEAAAAGREAEAAQGFARVAASALPLPGVQLAAARWFLGQGQYARAWGPLARAQACGLRVDPLLRAAARRAGAPPELQAQAIGRPGTALGREAGLKHQLLRHLPRTEAAAAWATLFAAHGRPEIVRRTLAGLAAWAQDHAALRREYCAAAELCLPMPALVGAPPPGLYAAHGRRLLCAAFDDAIVASRSNLVQLPDVVLHDHEDAEFAAVPADFAFDGQGFDEHAGEVTLIRFGAQLPRVETAISLVGCGSTNFGHWVAELLPRLFLIDAAGQAPDVPVLVDAGMPASHREALAWFDRGERPVIELPVGASVPVGRLWLATAAAYAPYVPVAGAPLRLEWLSARTEALAALLAAQRMPESANGPHRLFLGRSGGLQRQIVNQDAVQALCAGHGFERVALETMSFAEQLRLVHGATHIVGAAGSALLFAFLYGAPGLKILNLHPEALEETPTLTSIAAARGIDVQVLPGRCERPDPRRPGNADFSIEPATLATVLAAWEHAPDVLERPDPRGQR